MLLKRFHPVMLAAGLSISTISHAESVGKICRHIFLDGESPVSQSVTAIGKDRALIACLGVKNGLQSIVVVERKGAKSRVLVSSRPLYKGEVVSSQTYVMSGADDEGISRPIPTPVYRIENPIIIDKNLLKHGLFEIASFYSTDGEVWFDHDLLDLFRFDKNDSQLIGTFDSYSGGEGGDDWSSSVQISIDANGPLIVQRDVNSTPNSDQLNIVQYRAGEQGLIAVSTRSCANFMQDPPSAEQTATVTVSGGLCEDDALTKCTPQDRLRVNLLRTSHLNLEVKTLDGRRGYVSSESIAIDCPALSEKKE
jgi:hypothetical protein